MILDTRNNDVIRVVMGGAPSTTQPDFYTSWLELNDGAPAIVYAPGQSDGILDGVTPVEIIPAPTVEGNRVQAKFISVFNRDTADVALTVDFFDGTASRLILKVLLEPDWSLIWEPGGTFHVYDNNGLIVAGAANDANAIHDNVAGEIAAVTEKVTPVGADLLLIEDSAAANAKKRVQITNLPSAGGASANDVVQARRTTVLALTTSFVDVTLDATDEESDAAVIEHNVATDDIDVKATALYKISYSGDIRAPGSGNSTITMDSRVRQNDSTVLPGSESSVGCLADASLDPGEMHNHVEQTFYASLTASDKVTLQVSKVELAGSATYNADRLKLTVERAK